MKSVIKRIGCFAFTVFLLLLTFTGCDGYSSSNKGSGGFGGSKNDKFVPIIGGTSAPKETDAETDGGAVQNPNGGKYDKRVAITYDDGPHVDRTKKIVDELAKYGYRATFFVVGNRVDGTEYSGAEAMKYAVSKGNEIGIHAYTHDNYYDKCDSSTYNSELSKTEAAIKKAVPKCNVRLMRPVGGRITDARVEQCKYSVIMWGVDSEDWKYKDDVDKIVDNVMSNVRDGSIILMHDIYESTYEATVKILKRLNQEGYEVVTVSELIGNDIQAGQIYYRKPRET